MPVQIFSREVLLKLQEKATRCKVVRRGERIKIKLRTPRTLYVYITSNTEAEGILKNLKVPTEDI